MAYTTSELVRFSLGESQEGDDVLIDSAVDAATAAIDMLTGKEWEPRTGVRYFTAEYANRVPIDPVLSITSLMTDPAGYRTYTLVWAPTDYDLQPTNKSPKTLVRVAPNSSRSFPHYHKGVKIDGMWGSVEAVPANIAHAALLLAVRLYRRKDAVFGVMGSAEMGLLVDIAKRDPDVMLLLPAAGGAIY